MLLRLFSQSIDVLYAWTRPAGERDPGDEHRQPQQHQTGDLTRRLWQPRPDASRGRGIRRL